ncbi:MAG: aryldialkylphosphatase [Bryobacter sp.]
MATRRDFLALALPLASQPLYGKKQKKSILVHEHILVDFAGADAVSRSRYQVDDVLAKAKPHLDALVAQGCVRMLECTPNYLGRDPQLLKRLEAMTGLEIWTNTGLYAANNYRHLPRYAWQESALALAKRWVEEWKNGVEGVKPKFIKIGVNAGRLGEIDRKIVEAGGYAALETGLPLACHTGPPKDGVSPAREQMEILTKMRVPLRQWIWVHAQNEKDHAVHEEAARAGGWVEFDGINPRALDWHRECVEWMGKQKLLGRTLISHDSGWYRVGEPGGGNYNGYTYLYTDFLTKIPEKWHRRLLWDNPRAAFGK